MELASKIQTQINEIFGDTPVNLVGGSVRDIILGKTPKDWDFCTSLDPDAIEDAIRKAGRRPYLIGKRFGTIGFKVSIEHREGGIRNGSHYHAGFTEWVYIEVTSYRTEKYDGTSRKPQVSFTDDIDQDLSRRDFTMNAIVLLNNNTYYDPFGGRIDIISKKIKPVGKGKDRILEDPLRMLRAARFASQLDFEVDPNFIGMMRQHSSDILRVSKERWVIELDKILSSQNPQKGLDILMQTDIMKYIMPEVWLAFQDPICKENTYKQFDVMLEDGRFTLDDMWCMLTYYIGFPYTKKESKNKILFPGNREVRKELNIGLSSRLKFSNERTAIMLKMPTIKIEEL